MFRVSEDSIRTPSRVSYALENRRLIARLMPGVLRTSGVRYSIHVSGKWCITFEWLAPRASRVNLEQYH